MVDAEGIQELCRFINAQDHLANVRLEDLEGASRREQLGITSLGVIMLVANYMEAHGVSHAGFNPDWVNKLDSIEGIISVFRDIRRDNAATP